MRDWVTGRRPEPTGGAGGWTATLRAPRVGVTQPQKAYVCVWSTLLLSPACTDATLFLFQIFTADFHLTLALALPSPVVSGVLVLLNED